MSHFKALILVLFALTINTISPEKAYSIDFEPMEFFESFFQDEKEAETTEQAEELLGQFIQWKKANPEKQAFIQGEIIKEIIELNEKDMVEPILLRAFEIAKSKGLTPPELSGDIGPVLVKQFASMIDAQLIERGQTTESAGQEYLSWDALDKSYTPLMNKLGEMSHAKTVADPGFLTEINFLRGKVQGNNKTKLLIDGPEAFKAREKLISQAKKEINILTWAIYDDTTGEKTLEWLSQKVKDGVKVRVIVDGQTSMRPHYGETLEKLKEAGVEVIRWHATDPIKKYYGQHRKILMVDNRVMVAGGMNHGDVYSHMGEKSKWRDTDIQVEGPIVLDAQKLFTQIWNDQVKGHKLDNSLLESLIDQSIVESDFSDGPEIPGDEIVGLIDHDPTTRFTDPIYLTTLRAIKLAQKTIDIENAYVILTPPLEKALKEAIDRGIKVRVLSNSNESVDEPIVSVPILKSLKKLSEMGAAVYTKKGDTLHSKFFIVDGEFAWVGSYNLHPRSLRFEGESVVALFGEKSVEPLQKAFEEDVSPEKAQKVSSPDEIILPEPFMFGLGDILFFDLL